MESTIFVTIITAVIIFIIGQIILKFFLEPIQNQKEIIGKIVDALIFYANSYSSLDVSEMGMIFLDKGTNIDQAQKDEAYRELRKLSSLLTSKTHLIPCYKFFTILKITIPEKDIRNAASELIGLSNSMWSRTHEDLKYVQKRFDNICTYLKLNLK